MALTDAMEGDGWVAGESRLVELWLSLIDFTSWIITRSLAPTSHTLKVQFTNISQFLAYSALLAALANNGDYYEVK